MKLVATIIAAAMMMWASISAQAAEIPSPKVIAKADVGVGGPAIPGQAFGKADAGKQIKVAQRRNRRRKRRNAAAIIGGAALIAGAIAASGGAHAREPEYHRRWRSRRDDRRYRRRSQCRRLWRRCRRGNDWACDRAEDRGC